MKRKKKYIYHKRRKLAVFFLSMISSFQVSAQADFNDFFVFGDSLNDATHLTRAVAGGYPPQGDYVSRALVGKELKDYKNGGNSYARSLGQIPNFLSIIPGLGYEYEIKFDKNKIGENNLFYIMIGNNDAVTSNFIAAPIPALDIFKLSDSIIRDRASYMKNIIKELGNSGKNTIIVSTLLDMGMTPIITTLPIFPRWDIISYVDTVLLGGGFHYNFNQPFSMILDFVNQPMTSDFLYQLGVMTDRKLREYTTNSPKPDSLSGADYYNQVRKGFYKDSLIGRIIAPAIYFVEDFIKNVMTEYTLDYSNALIQAYSETDENIVFLNFRKLLMEIFDNQKEFGFDNILIPQCTAGIAPVQDTLCTVGNTNFHDDQIYLFSDFVHPSPITHEIMGNYIISVLSAPVQFGSIFKHLFSADMTSNDYLKTKLTEQRLSAGEVGGFSPFVSYSGYSTKSLEQKGIERRSNFNHILNLGIVYQLNEKNQIGVILNAGFGDSKPYKNYEFGYNQQKISLFYQLKLDSQFWLNTDVGLGRFDASDIRRSIQFVGDHKRTEKGSTSGQSLSLNVKIGYDYLIQEESILTPYLGLSYNHYKIDGYKEKSNRATSMQFEKIKAKQNYGTVGVQFSTVNKPVNIFADLSYNHSFSDDEISVSSGSKAAPRNYKRAVLVNDKNWTNLQLGANKEFSNKMILSGSAGYKYAKNSGGAANVSFGVSYKY